jgi:UDP-N-acetylglucosamine--N-acetylmuramyl-(pentapeptide) pyrophosphoryl-undecaprenol N-acetylglucosamine transferase
MAVVDELESRLTGIEVLFAISRRGLEERVLQHQGYRYTPLISEGFHRREIVRNLLFPIRTLGGLFQSIGAVRRFRPNVAFGTGGFVSGPALLAAWLMRIPVVLLALDAVPGSTIRLLAPIARQIFVTHPGARTVLHSHPSVDVIGTPVRAPERIDHRAARSSLGVPRAGLLLLVTGGSQGSRLLNQVVASGLGGLLDIAGLAILWQTGEQHLEEAGQAAEKVLASRPAYDRPRLKIVPFIEQMNVAWSAADLALCRAGASTLAELTNYGVPAVLVPLATSAGGHQEANARAMKEAGAACMILEDAISGEKLVSIVSELLEGALEGMATTAARMAHAGAAHRVAEGLVNAADGLEESRKTEMLDAMRGMQS